METVMSSIYCDKQMCTRIIGQCRTFHDENLHTFKRSVDALGIENLTGYNELT
jgi:hypothetical protein